MSDWYTIDVIRDFDNRTGWVDQFSYSNVANVSKRLINFRPPSAVSLSLSSKTSPYTYSSMVLSSKPGDETLNASVAYIYELVNGKLVSKAEHGSADLYHDYIEGFNKYYKLFIPDNTPDQSGGDNLDRTVSTLNEPTRLYELDPVTRTIRAKKTVENLERAAISSPKKTLKSTMSYKNSCLYYGKMYFPYSVLEGTHIKNISENSRIQTNIWSNRDKFLFTSYYQYQSNRHCHELCYSNAESLLGFRSSYKFSIPSTPDMPFILNNDEIQLGSEWWVGFKNMVPNCSLSFRYKTVTGMKYDRPLNFSLSVNPLMGHIQSTFGLIEEISKNDKRYDYRINDMVGFFSQYNFNIYSLKSNLSFGLSFQGWKIGLNLKNRNIKMAYNKKLGENFILSTGFNMNLPPPNTNRIFSGSNSTASENVILSHPTTRAPIKFGLELRYIGD